ncbi:hypothetical protein GGX14DRAFT_574964 [Mycena pura]|uniref:DUF6534 domain-containing protein n=1 Tax=Mycena pura TaxID=153505 RepID=A0AAD6UW13_9AGAR|nr:hypothetical protein GGX14DRAFT_574964 [Mycena pura]
MATAPVPLPNVQLLCVLTAALIFLRDIESLRPYRRYGPMLVGVFFNMILYGVLVGQVLTYYASPKPDALWMRVFIACLFFIETANTALDMSMMYQPLILDYGQKPVFFPTVFMTDPLCVVLVSMPIQLFFAWRIYQLTKSPWIPAVIAVFAVASFAGGVWTATMVQVLRLFAKKPMLHDPALLWFLAACVADVLITVSLVTTLSKKKTGFSATDSVVDKIIRMTIQTGMVTALFSILDVVTFMALPHIAVNFVWDLALSKLYSNCLLSTLNARQTLNSASHASTFQQRRSVLSPRQSGKQDLLDTVAGNGSATYTEGPRDLEYGIHMTKIVERMEDTVPGTAR